MNRTEQLITGTLGLLITACACIAAWLVIYVPTPAPSPSNTPLSASEYPPAPTIADSPTPALTFTPNWTPTSTPVRNSQIEFFIYYDDDNNGRFGVTNNGEPYGPDYLITQAVVELYAGSSCSGAVLATAHFFLAYVFSDLEAGTYCVKVVNDSITNPGGCALVPGQYGETKPYYLLPGEAKQDYDAGFPYRCQ